jgi:hypothetical protein
MEIWNDENVAKQTPKPWWMSRTILGGIAAIIAGMLGLSSCEDADLIRELLTQLASVAGGVLAIYGRIKATRAIGALPSYNPSVPPAEAGGGGAGVPDPER